MTKWTEFSFALRPSALSGIGVFATHDIPKGTRVYTNTFKMRKLKANEIPDELRKYCIYLENDECLCPERFDHMDVSWYMNHADEPNLVEVSEGHVIAARDIKEGDEITVDYNALGEPEHLKEDFYKKVVA